MEELIAMLALIAIFILSLIVLYYMGMLIFKIRKIKMDMTLPFRKYKDLEKN